MKHFIASALLAFFITALMLVGSLINPGKIPQGEIVVMGTILFVVLILGTLFTHEWVNATALRFWSLFSVCLILGLLAIGFVSFDAYTSERFVSYLQGHVAQVSMFFLLCFSTSFLLRHEFLKIKYPFLIALLYSVAILFLTEYLQSVFVYDFFNLLDVFFGGLGAISYYVLAHVIRLISRIV